MKPVVAFLLFSSALCHASTAWVTVCCNNPGPVSLYNTLTGQALPDINTGAANPNDAVFSTDGKTVYVANGGPNEFDPTVGQITFIDTASGAITRTIPVNNAPYALFLSPNGSKLYVIGLVSNLNKGPFTVYSIDIASGSVVASSVEYASNGVGFGDLLFAPDGTKVYLLTYDYIYVLNAYNLQQTGYLNIGLPLLSGAISPDGSTIFVPSPVFNRAAIKAVDAGTLQIKWTLPISSERVQGPIVLDASGGTLYAVVKSTPRTLVAVSTATRSVISTSPIDGYPEDLALSPDAQTLYGILQGALISTQISTGVTKVLEALPSQPNFLSLSAANGLIVVGNPNNDEIQGIDLATGATKETILIGNSLASGGALKITPDGKRAISVEENGISEPDFETGRNVGRAYVPGASAAIYVAGTQTAYVVGGAYTESTSQLYAVNLQTGYAGDKLALPFTAAFVTMALSPDGKTLYIASPYENIMIVDTETFQQTGTIPIMASVIASTAAQSSLLYFATADLVAPQFGVWSVLTQSSILTVPLEADYADYIQLQIEADGARAYVMDGNGTVNFIDVSKGTLQWSSYAGGPEGGLSFAVSPDGKLVALTEQFTAILIVLDGLTGAEITTYPLIGPGGAVVTTE